MELELKDFTQPTDTDLLYRHLVKNYPGAKYKAGYEAGFCGFGIQRQLTALGIECVLLNAADISKGDKERKQKKEMLSKNATVMTDGKTAYRVLENIAKKHRSVIVKDKTQVSKIFPRVHIAISNVKKKILGLHHSVKDTYMQNYLNEFCYKFNRRNQGTDLFHSFLKVATSYSWYATCT